MNSILKVYRIEKRGVSAHTSNRVGLKAKRIVGDSEDTGIRRTIYEDNLRIQQRTLELIDTQSKGLNRYL